MYSQKSAICSLNRCLHYLNEIRGLLLNAIKTLLVGKFLNALCMRLGSPVLEMQMYDQQQNTAVVVINWSCTSLWAKLLWQPASHAGKRAATAYKSALDPSVGGRRGEGGCVKNAYVVGEEVSKALVWNCRRGCCDQTSIWSPQFFSWDALIFPFSPYEHTSHDAYPAGSATYWQIIQSSPSSALGFAFFG